MSSDKIRDKHPGTGAKSWFAPESLKKNTAQLGLNMSGSGSQMNLQGAMPLPPPDDHISTATSSSTKTPVGGGGAMTPPRKSPRSPVLKLLHMEPGFHGLIRRLSGSFSNLPPPAAQQQLHGLNSSQSMNRSTQQLHAGGNRRHSTSDLNRSRRESIGSDCGSRFTILREQPIGRGSFGDVFKAVDNETGRTVAVKEATAGRNAEKLESSIQKESELLMNLENEYIVHVIGIHVCLESRKTQVFMEWMSGGSVAGLIHEMSFRLHERVVRRYLRDVLKGLAYLHSQGIVHRDVKPANMLVDGPTGRVKLSDFGAYKLASNKEGECSSTNTIVGTAAYMAPESVSKGKYSFASDIWALGCCSVDMLSGEMPWACLPEEQQGVVQLMFHIGSAREPFHPEIPLQVSSELRRIITGCFDLDPSKRPTASILLNEPYFCEIGEQHLPEDAENLETYKALRQAHQR